MNKKIPGVLSLLFIFSAALLAVYYLFQIKTDYAIIYLVSVFAGSLLMVRSWCTKCSRSDRCPHIIPGFMIKLMKKREPGKYERMDYAGLIAGFLLILLPPQFWLIQSLPHFLIFWGMIILGIIEIRLYLCKDCNNSYCVLSGNRIK